MAHICRQEQQIELAGGFCGLSRPHKTLQTQALSAEMHHTGIGTHLGRQGLGGGFKGRPHGVIQHSPKLLLQLHTHTHGL